MICLKRRALHLFAVCMTIPLVSCKEITNKEKTIAPMERESKTTIEKSNYGVTTDSVQVDLFTMRNSHGMEVDIITY